MHIADIKLEWPDHRCFVSLYPTAISMRGIAVITTTGVTDRWVCYPRAVLIGAYTQCYCALGFSSWTLLLSINQALELELEVELDVELVSYATSSSTDYPRGNYSDNAVTRDNHGMLLDLDSLEFILIA